MWKPPRQGESHMHYPDPFIDFNLIQRKPGVGIQPTTPSYAVVLWEGDVLHDKGKMFCYNPSCSCHDNPLLIERVARFVLEGLCTPEEATNFVAGRTI